MARRLPVALAATVCALSLCAAARAAVPVQPYGSNDFGGFRDVLPPGTNGLVNGPQLLAFQATGARPPHSDDQLGMYRDLVYAAPGLAAQDIPRFYKDSTFGVKPEDVARTYSPRADVTIVRDKQFGVPHVYGATQAGALFGLGYAAAEDRLFFMDVLRHLGRAQLASFAGGAPANRAFDEEQWKVAPYNEEDLQRQIDQLDDLYGDAGANLQGLLSNYVDGINQYISEARLDITKMPGEYAALGRPQGPDPWKGADVVATASLVGAIFGKGGGEEITMVKVLQAFRARFGRKLGTRLFYDFRSAEDPEAPVTVHGRRFTYEATPRRHAKGSVALPDRGTLRDEPEVVSGGSQSAGSGGSGGLPGLGGILGLPNVLEHAQSNALLVSGRESASGRPLAVFGPQVAYFNPQILMEQDVHAPGWDARGAAFPGVNVLVELGHGRDYAWSATSAGEDIIDTFAVDLCNADGSAPSLDSTGYEFRGACRPMETLERTNSWQPNLADSTPAGSETLRAYRTALGIVVARGTIKGRPVAYTRLRSTYMHEADSALGFKDFNDPNVMTSPAGFASAAYKVGYTFNWFYIDDKHIAYFNSGNNPVRARRTDGLLPIRARQRFEWRNFNPDNVTAAYTPAGQHPQVVDQSYLTSWNNKQARGYRGDYPNVYSSLYRSQPLDDRVKAGIKGSRKMTLPGLIDAMEDAGTVDLRGAKVLPWALKVIGTPRDARVAAAVSTLRAWVASGAHRRDRDHSGTYDDAAAVRILDAWWPLWMRAEFEPRMGTALFDAMHTAYEFDNSPNNKGDHLGSAYQDGWYGFAQKDLRAVLKRRVKGRYARKFCGRGHLRACRAALTNSLRAALDVSPTDLYRDQVCSSKEGQGMDPQMCFDAVRFRPLGAVSQPLIPWINRPTYQQAVEVQGHR